MLSPDYLRSIASKVKKHIQIRSTVDSAPGTKGNPPEATALYFANAVAEDTIHGAPGTSRLCRFSRQTESLASRMAGVAENCGPAGTGYDV